MSTAANVSQSGSSRFYTPDGHPVWEIPKKSGVGMKKPTIVDARENGWLPSVTTILKVLNRPALNTWLQEQAILAVLTTPRMPGEGTDAFVQRVLQEERVQDETADKAAQLGTDIHGAIEDALNNQPWDKKLAAYVNPVLDFLPMYGRKVWSEKVLVGEGYAGRSDYLGDDGRTLTLADFKSASKPPKEPYPEAVMQAAAYAKTLGNVADRHIQTAIIYISTTEPGKCVTFVQEDWQRNYEAFSHVLAMWRYLNGV